MDRHGSFARIPGAILSAPTGKDALELLTAAAVEEFDHVDLASITTVEGTEIDTVAPTDPVAAKLDLLQYQHREGPCFEAATDGIRVLVATDLGHDARWPLFGAEAVEFGVRAMTAYRLLDQGHFQASLNLYSSRIGAISPEPALLELFAGEVALALGYTRTLDSLHRALDTRTIIGTAVGLVMARYELDREHAFAFLVRQSSTSNVKLRTVCENLVREAEHPSGDRVREHG